MLHRSSGLSSNPPDGLCHPGDFIDPAVTPAADLALFAADMATLLTRCQFCEKVLQRGRHRCGCEGYEFIPWVGGGVVSYASGMMMATTTYGTQWIDVTPPGHEETARCSCPDCLARG